MNFFRRLDAALSGEMPTAQATTSRPTETVIAPDAWIPAPDQPKIWAALAAVGNSDGVIDHTTAGPFLPDGT